MVLKKTPITAILENRIQFTDENDNNVNNGDTEDSSNALPFMNISWYQGVVLLMAFYL